MIVSNKKKKKENCLLEVCIIIFSIDNIYIKQYIKYMIIMNKYY